MHFCSREHLTRRFEKPDRLAKRPPYECLPPIHSRFDGSLSFYRVAEAAKGVTVTPAGNIRSQKKIQHALALDAQNLLVGFETHLEQWFFPKSLTRGAPISEKSFRIEKTIRHPHLPGLRTVNRLDRDRVVVASAAADAVLLVNWVSGLVEKTLSLPCDLYGHGYDLTPEMDLARHYIGNQHQRTHLNSGYAHDGKVVISTLIQGAIGVFDLESGAYRELTRDHVGCHGARFNSEGEVYFVDSCSGQLIFLDAVGRPSRSYRVGSLWLHDAVQISDRLYAFALADSNELQVHDIHNESMVYRKRFLTSPFFLLNPLFRLMPAWIGNSAQFLAYRADED